jgi:MAP3K TRAFs-binding domain
MSLCFVLMPFGIKAGADGKKIDFDSVYKTVIRPAVIAAELDPLRCDEDQAGGFIQKSMFEALILCEYAVADLTTANPNVFYELGIRHAVRPWSTVPIMAEGGRLPIDVDALKTIFYKLGPDGIPAPQSIDVTCRAVSSMLREAKSGTLKDSPIYQLIDYYPQPQLDREKADLFRTQVQYSRQMKDELARMTAQNGAVDALKAMQEQLGDLQNVESGVLIDLMLSYRSQKAFKEMIRLVDGMPQPLRQTAMVQEQYALALNRDNQGGRAERVLLDLLEKRGPSSETYGILGRIHKDRWEIARQAGDDLLARGFLNKAIAAYLKGFETDWRDAFPGINAVSLMELRDPPDPRRLELIPVVRYSVERRIATGAPDYWDLAILLELATLAGDEERAMTALTDALAAVREIFEPDTTARNLRFVVEAKRRRGQFEPWMERIVEKLRDRAQYH